MRTLISLWRSALLCAFVISVAALVACVPAVDDATPTAGPTAELPVPEPVVEAREAVLDFLRDGANICVPPVGVHWRPSVGRTSEGFDVYRFNSEGCLITVSYGPDAAAPIYHVGLHNGETGFCWQANVDEHGRVVDTGSAAALPSELATAAEVYCLEQGYTHEVQEQPDGSSCGVCVFPDASTCKAWLYYQGECGPGDYAARVP